MCPRRSYTITVSISPKQYSSILGFRVYYIYHNSDLGMPIGIIYNSHNNNNLLCVFMYYSIYYLVTLCRRVETDPW